MRIVYIAFIAFLFLSISAQAQNTISVSPCSEKEILKRHIAQSSNAMEEMKENEHFTKNFVAQLQQDRLESKKQKRAQYTIPVVLHVFHNGNDAKIDMAQAQSGMDILNTDFNGLNNDWNTIDPRFDSIKATLDIRFCLATKDTAGNPTTGVLYYDDSLMMLNIGNLFQYAWDNTKYLNIYLPKYTGGSPSLFTAYAYYPSTARTNSNTDGIFYSSIRWGYGSNSQLTPGQEWASVGTHETGHWLNLRHTFENGCSTTNDFVNDTPPTLGGTIEIAGCKNNDSSCGVPTNGSNYMDYNHDCKKMFTRGQVDRMTAALNLPSRINLWSSANLLATGCAFPISVEEHTMNRAITVYPNPAHNKINFKFETRPNGLAVYDVYGSLISKHSIPNSLYKLDVSELANGIYFYHAAFDDYVVKGKFVVN